VDATVKQAFDGEDKPSACLAWPLFGEVRAHQVEAIIYWVGSKVE
jgi:hypothetical protein